MSRPLHRALLVAGAAALAVGLAAAPAAAHVTANSVNATQGGFAMITFRVPTERDTASTTKLRLEFPAEDPLATVLVKPHLGWTYRVTKRQLDPPVQIGGRTLTEAVSVIEWTSLSALTAIKPGEFDDFDILAGPMPRKSAITFRAVQTYSSGEQVVWTPTLALASPPAAATSQPVGMMAGQTASLLASQQAPAVARGTSEPAGDVGGPYALGGAYALGGLGLLAGLAGLTVAFITRRRSAARRG